MDTSKNLLKLKSHYNNLFQKFKESYKTAQQSSRETQKKRMKILIENFKFNNQDRILDFGCGTAFLYKYLIRKKNFKGYYTGIDISDKIIRYNKIKFKKNKKVNFLNLDISKKKVNLKNYDYVFISGTFNNKINNNWLWMKICLKKIFKSTKKVLVFNNLSHYVDYKDKNLFYIRPEKVFSYCKRNLSNYVILRNEYQIKKRVIPFEFTTYVFKKN